MRLNDSHPSLPHQDADLDESPRETHGDHVQLFLHLPKTGGTTLNEIVYAQHAGPEPRPRSSTEEEWFHWGVYHYPSGFYQDDMANLSPEIVSRMQKDDVKAVVGHFSFGLDEYLCRPSTYFTMVRDPIERVISLYHHILRYSGRDDPMHRRIKDNYVNLYDFVSDIQNHEVHNCQTRRLAGIHPDYGGQSIDILDIAKSNIDKYFRFIGVTERFSESIMALTTLMNWRDVEYLSYHVNDSRPRSNDLSFVTRELIVSQNKLDIELHQYANTMLNALIERQSGNAERG